MALNLNLLRSFFAVVQAGSVSKAARSGFISQPALSKAIKELEKSVGIALTERSPRGIKLTEAGETLFRHAKVLFAQEKEAEEALRYYQNAEMGTLRIGASTTLTTYVLPPILAQFRSTYPRLHFKTLRGNTREIEEALSAYELDVALIEGPSHHPKIRAQSCGEDELVCVCAPNHPLATQKDVTLSSLKQFDWIVREEGSGTREVTENLLRMYQLPPRDALEIGGAEAMKQSIAAGLGIGIVSRIGANDQIALGKLVVVHLTGAKLLRPYYLLHLEGRPLLPAAKIFEKYFWEFLVPRK